MTAQPRSLLSLPSWAAIVLVLSSLLLAVRASEAQCQAALEAMKNPTNTTALLVLQMHAANGHGNMAFTTKGLIDIGNWASCHEIEATRYCTIFNNLTSLGYGACVPSACSADDLESLPRSLVVTALDLEPLKRVPTKLRVTCTAPPPMPTGGKVVLGIITVLAALVVVGTLLDLQLNDKLLPLEYILSRASDSPTFPSKASLQSDDLLEIQPLQSDGDAQLYATPAPTSRLHETYESLKSSVPIQLLLAFSLPTNFSKLLAPAPPGDMPALNGIRVLSLCWVIMGHTWSALVALPIMNANAMIDVVQRFRFQVVYSGYYSVDTFFVLSGFLVAYLFIKQISQSGVNALTFPVYYLHRVWRLLPSIALMVFTYWLVVPSIGNGPNYSDLEEIVDGVCPQGWWWTLLFINNFTNNRCAGWTWYLSDDMQFYVVAPLVLLVYLRNRILGWVFTGALILGSLIWTLVIVIVNDVHAFPILDSIGLGHLEMPSEAAGNALNIIYVRPWTRCGPYLVGFILAFILIEQGFKVRVRWLTRTLVLSTSAFGVFVLTFITYTEAHWGWSAQAIHTTFLTFAHPAWAVVVATWMLFMIWGYGGVVRSFLSAGFWVPLARLSFGAYLWQSVVIFVIYGSFSFAIPYTTWFMVFMWWSIIIMAFICGLVNYILLEKPLMNIEKMLLGSLKH